MAVPLRFHWYVGDGEPLAAAVNVTPAPAVTVWFDGCVVKLGAVPVLAAVTTTV